jgi:hypothetical protein
MLSVDGRTRSAHIVAWELLIGPIPEGRELHHRCENKGCANPWHLLPLTSAEHKAQHLNQNTAKTHCPAGHPYDEANTYVRHNGHRSCRACRRV